MKNLINIILALAALATLSGCVEGIDYTPAPVVDPVLQPLPDQPGDTVTVQKEDAEPSQTQSDVQAVSDEEVYEDTAEVVEEFTQIEAPEDVAIDTGIKGEILLGFERAAFFEVEYMWARFGGVSVEAGEKVLIKNMPAGIRNITIWIEAEDAWLSVDLTVEIPRWSRVEAEVVF